MKLHCFAVLIALSFASVASAEEPVDLALHLMDWKRIRHVPVENEEGQLVGMVSWHHLLRSLRSREDVSTPTSVRDIAGAAGMLPGSLYCHFATKEDLDTAYPGGSLTYLLNITNRND